MFSAITSRLSTMVSSTPKEKEHLLIILPFPEPTNLISTLEKTHPNIRVTYKQQIPTAGKPFWHHSFPDSLFSNATILATLGAFPSTPEAAKTLKFIHLGSAGSDHVQKTRIWSETDIIITTSSGIHGPMISEWVILQMLSWSHKQKLLLEWMRERRWGGHAELGVRSDWVGKRLGVLGYGSIGRQVAVVAKSMGMEVYAYTASPRKTPDSKRDTGYVVPGTGDLDGTIPSAWFSGTDKPSLHNFLSQSLDVLLISLPLTAATNHLISTEELDILSQTTPPSTTLSPGTKEKKQGTFIANISRGSIINQDKLEEYLREGKIGGAALDVTDPEPLPKDSTLWDVGNVVVTPHVSGLSEAYLERSLAVLERNLGLFEKGEKLINVVDRKRGY